MRSTLFISALLVTAAGASSRAGAEPTKGTDYADEIRTLYRVAACGGDDAISDKLKGQTRTIDAHCKEMASVYKSYKKEWADQAASFIAELRPRDIPKTVVYPFGGGDLTSALVVYPDATEITTISLEAAGDVRVVNTIKPSTLANDLDSITFDIRRLFRSAHSTTKSLQAASHSTIPGTVMFMLAGMTVHDMEPVSFRYFDIEPDGSLRYLANDEIDKRVEEFAAAKRGKTPPKKITHYWYEQDSPFANMEIQYRPRGDAKAPIRTYRHIVANLDDPHMTGDDRVIKHLQKKGKVSVMTKAASFLLWYDDFTQIRDYLLKNVAWMISDASGIPPSYAEPAGFEQVTYGDFTGPYFVIDDKNVRAQFIKMWKDKPHHALPFRFGYPDNANHNHLMITRPKAP